MFSTERRATKRIVSGAIWDNSQVGNCFGKEGVEIMLHLIKKGTTTVWKKELRSVHPNATG